MKYKAQLGSVLRANKFFRGCILNYTVKSLSIAWLMLGRIENHWPVVMMVNGLGLVWWRVISDRSGDTN